MFLKTNKMEIFMQEKSWEEYVKIELLCLKRQRAKRKRDRWKERRKRRGERLRE